MSYGASYERYELRVSASVRISRVSPGFADSPPCNASGAAELERDGDHLVVTFGRGTFDGIKRESDAFLDLELTEGGHCLRVPVGNDVARYRREPPWFIEAGLGLHFLSPAGEGVQSVLSVPLGGGAWAGPVKLTAFIAPGSAVCEKTTCPSPDPEKSVLSFAMPVGAKAMYYPVTWSRRAIGGALGVGAGYSVTLAQLPVSGTNRDVAIHNAYGVLSFGLLEPTLKGASHRPEQGSMVEFQLPVGIAVSSSSFGEGVGAFGGLTLLFVQPL